jgi:hypothetical protein
MKALTGSAIFLTSVIVIACHTAYKATDFSVKDVNVVTENWPANTKEASNLLISKFGVPDEVTNSTLVWKDRGVWKKTVLMRDGIPHDFPMPHTDYLMQTINYKVPVEKYDDLAQYDGSVIVDRTNGTLSARCDKEEMNFLALNLAHDIITGRKTVDEARDNYAKTAMRFKEGRTDTTRMDTTRTDPGRMDTTRTDPSRTDRREGSIDRYLQGLQFSVPQGETGDRDVPAKMK